METGYLSHCVNLASAIYLQLQTALVQSTSSDESTRSDNPLSVHCGGMRSERLCEKSTIVNF